MPTVAFDVLPPPPLVEAAEVIPTAPESPPVPVLTSPLSDEAIDYVLALAGWDSAFIGQAKQVAWCESRWHPDSVNSSSGAAGLFQLWDGWARWAQYPRASLLDPISNARIAWLVFHEYYYDSWRAWECLPH